jgi:hypothetical protein
VTPQQYIQGKLEELRDFHPRTIPKEHLADEIFRLLMSKKFRKWSAGPDLVAQMKSAIAINIEKKQPVNLTFPHGAYKLWRLEETPLPDWAELFTAMYYTAWTKSVCEIYAPGVWFDYFVDDLILPIIDNIPVPETESYLTEYRKVLDFLRSYQPINFRMTVTRFESEYGSRQKFEKELQARVDKLAATNPVFTEKDLQTVQLNARPTAEQLLDPRWKEKIRLVHDAYIFLKRDLNYYYQPEKIPVFCQPLPSGKFIAVGTTKTSAAKFWVGVGALKKTEGGYIEYILTPTQMEKVHFTKAPVSIKGLSGKNFRSINVFS